MSDTEFGYRLVDNAKELRSTLTTDVGVAVVDPGKGSLDPIPTHAADVNAIAAWAMLQWHIRRH